MVFFDCQACGACCLNTAKNRAADTRDYIEVVATDALRNKANQQTLSRFATRNESGAWHLRLIGDEQRCAGLDGDLGAGVGCTLYKIRPAGCRAVESGDEECLKARRFWNLPVTLTKERARLAALDNEGD